MSASFAQRHNYAKQDPGLNTTGMPSDGSLRKCRHVLTHFRIEQAELTARLVWQ